MHRLKDDICSIQETHFKSAQIQRFTDRRFMGVYHSCAQDSKTRGVSILVGNTVPWTLKDTWSDDEGRMLFVKGLVGSQFCTLASLY